MSKRSDLPPLSEAQLEIMNVVWDRGEATVGEVWNALSAGRDVARNTVQTMIVRLEEKGWLQHRSGGQGFIYRATHLREETQKTMVRRLLETAFAGSTEGLLLALLGDRSLSKAEADRIRALIDEAARRKL